MNSIRAIRKRRGLSQATAASQLGISPSYLSEIETGVKPISSRRLMIRVVAWSGGEITLSDIVQEPAL